MSLMVLKANRMSEAEGYFLCGPNDLPARVETGYESINNGVGVNKQIQ